MMHAPAVPLAGRRNTTGAPFELESYLVDDRLRRLLRYGSSGTA